MTYTALFNFSAEICFFPFLIIEVHYETIVFTVDANSKGQWTAGGKVLRRLTLRKQSKLNFQIARHIFK